MYNSKLRNHWLCYFLSSFLFISACKRIDTGKIIVTQTPSEVSANYVTGEGWRYIGGSQLVMIDPEDPGSPELLTGDFHSACSPDISWDAKVLLFAGQKEINDPWQIWKMDLKTRKVTRVTQIDENCADPVYLPNGRIVFSKSTGQFSNDHALFTCNGDGSDCRQITFFPHTNFVSSILRDGRIVSLTRQTEPNVKDPMVMVLRPDGTKAELFYRGKKGALYMSRLRESDDGRIFFVEADSSQNGRLMSIKYNRPIFSSTEHSLESDGSFNSVYPAGNGRLIVSWRDPESTNYALYEMDVNSGKPDRKIYAPGDKNVTEVLLVKENIRPKKLPSEVDIGVKTGLLICQDINFTGLGIESHNVPKLHRVEIIGVDSSMGIVPVEKDGSFYLKVIADMPFQIRTLDDKGKAINQSAWIWLRPNERRGCIGCHEHPEITPDNRVPLSVKKDPVIIPVSVSNIVEKEVELE